MLNYIRLLRPPLLFVCALGVAHSAFSMPAPPEIESEVGYLNVEKRRRAFRVSASAADDNDIDIAFRPRRNLNSRNASCQSEVLSYTQY